MFKLESVGCWIDESGVCFSANENGDPDYTETGVPVEECRLDWHSTLDATDSARVQEIIEYYEIKIPDGETKGTNNNMDTIELTKQQARILNELSDMLAPDYKGNELVLEGLAASAQATQAEIQDTMDCVFHQTSIILNTKKGE